MSCERFVGKAALVTGGGTGIGKATATLLAEEGAGVLIVGRRGDKLAETVNLINGQGREAFYFQGDVSRRVDAENVIRAAVGRFGRLDIVFNNAAVDYLRRLTDMGEEDWDRVIATNLKSAFLVSKYAIPEMLKLGRGVIINNSSISAIMTTSGEAAYGASKAGLVMLTKSIALEYGTKGIRCNCVCPGSVDTEMARARIKDEADPRNALRKMGERNVGIKRLITPEEIAKVVAFLASEDASAITGSTIVVDGGYTMSKLEASPKSFF
jgi:NAD(P)-dependent dehydrogenase (short-subunit alcohol dehydrogenase family)